MKKWLVCLVLAGCDTTASATHCTDKTLSFGNPSTMESMCTAYGTCAESGIVGCIAQTDAACAASLTCKSAGACVLWKTACATPADAQKACQATCLPTDPTATVGANGACNCNTPKP